MVLELSTKVVPLYSVHYRPTSQQKPRAITIRSTDWKLWSIADEVGRRIDGAVAGVRANFGSVIAHATPSGSALGSTHGGDEGDAIAVRTLVTAFEAGVDTLSTGSP